MLKKSIASVAMALSATVWFFGCSNDSSPVSIGNNTNQTVAALTDVALWDICAAGSSVWGMSQERPAGSNGNWCIYLYNTSNQLWTKTTHFGMNVATTPSGKCYHSSSNSGVHQLWWGTLNANGQIPLPAGMTLIMDVSAGRVGVNDNVWIICSNGTLPYTYYVYVYKYVNGVQQWVNMTKDLNNVGGNLHSISVDPYDGNKVLLLKDPWKFYALTSENGSWTLQSTPYRSVEGTIRGNVTAYETEYYKIYKGTVNGNYNGNSLASDCKEFRMGMDASYLYYIGPSYKAKRITY